MEQYYKREGRRFVKADMPNIINTSGKYYQKDGSFTEERTKDSIGLCIMSTPKEHVVMSLVTFYSGNFNYVKSKLKNEFNGHGEMPKLHELVTALTLFKEELKIHKWEYIWAIHPISSTPHTASASDYGYASLGPAASTAICVAGLRSIIRIPQKGKRLENYDKAEKEKTNFVSDGFIECHADFLDFKEGNTYWLEYIGDDKYNVRSDNLLGKTYHITPCQLYTVFKKLTWLEKQKKV